MPLDHAPVHGYCKAFEILRLLLALFLRFFDVIPMFATASTEFFQGKFFAILRTQISVSMIVKHFALLALQTHDIVLTHRNGV